MAASNPPGYDILGLMATACVLLPSPPSVSGTPHASLKREIRAYKSLLGEEKSLELEMKLRKPKSNKTAAWKPEIPEHIKTEKLKIEVNVCPLGFTLHTSGTRIASPCYVTVTPMPYQCH
jgi:hypothetical protein